MRCGVLYSYDGTGNIVRSIDILNLKEYNYEYEEGRILRSTQSDITLNGEIVTDKTVVNSIRYFYDTEGTLTKKVIAPTGGEVQTISYEQNEDNTVVRYKVPAPEEVSGERTITAHSKTDSFGRKVFDELQLGTGFVSRQFSYHAGEVTPEHEENRKLKSSPTTNLVSQITFSGGDTVSYTYDKEDRITSVVETYTDGEEQIVRTTAYTYDALGQLLTETVNGTVVNTMTYDNYGNILTKNGIPYTYGDSAWKDKLTAYNVQAITYDAQGNPIKYRGNTLVWEKGRQLQSFSNYVYTYNANGIRTSKTVNTGKHEYILDGTKILRETWGNNTLVPLYDNEDSVCGIIYNDEPFYFRKNLQGDIIAIVNDQADVVARYSYDAWGMPTTLSDTSGCSIATVNPFRYRGYYYDPETGLYYLQSRYYDPYTARFLNTDECALIAMPVEIILEQNLFQYALNSPIKNVDANGYCTNIAYYSTNTAYYVSHSLATQMAALSAAGASLFFSLKSLLKMLWNIYVVVGLLVVAIAAIVYICNSITKIHNDIKSKVDEKLKDSYKNFKNKICVYVLTRKHNPLQSIFYVGRTKNIIARYSKHNSPSSKYYKGDFYMFVIHVCSSEAQSRIVEQAVLSACLVGEFTQIIFGQSPSNRIRSIASSKVLSVINELKENNELNDTLSLLGCTSESDLLYSMNQ